MKPVFRLEKIILVWRENLRGSVFLGSPSDGSQRPRMYSSASVRKSKISLALVGLRGLLKGVLHLKNLLFNLSNNLSNKRINLIVGPASLKCSILSTSLQNSRASATDLLVENVENDYIVKLLHFFNQL